MARTCQIIVRLTEKEKQKLQAYSQDIGVSMSEIVQDWIKALPPPVVDNYSTVP